MRPFTGHPRVLFIGHFFSHHAGTRSITEDVSEQLKNKSWSIVTTSHYQERIPRMHDMISTVVLKRKLYDLAVVDVYSGIAFNWAEIACALLRQIGKPFAIVLRGGGLGKFAQNQPRRVQRMLSLADITITPSNYLRESLLQFRRDFHYLPNGINIHAYHFKLRSAPTPRLVWLRAFHLIYNPCLAVTVLANVISDYPNASLTMIGPDKGDGSLQKVNRLAWRYGVKDRLLITGKVAKRDVPYWLSGRDIFLNTTNYESFGVAVMESAALGLDIVSSDVGELSYLWNDGKEALLVPPDDASAMTGAVRRLLCEPDLARELSRKARRKAEQFDWGNVLPLWENLLCNY